MACNLPALSAWISQLTKHWLMYLCGNTPDRFISVFTRDDFILMAKIITLQTICTLLGVNAFMGVVVCIYGLYISIFSFDRNQQKCNIGT